MATLLLTKEQVRGLIRVPDVIAAVEDAFRAFSGGEVVQPPYMGLHMSEPRAEIDFKACYHAETERVSLKASSGGFRDNPGRYSLPNGMGTVLLFDGSNGALLCAMDGSLLTGFRTGAAGAVSVRAMAREDARVLAMIGTGNQARMQIRAIREVIGIDRIHAWGRSPAGLAAFKTDIEAEFGLPVIAAGSAQEAVAEADIVVTTTRASGIVLQAGWLRPGTHVVAIGADQKGKQELSPEIFHTARIVADSRTQCREKGEVQHAIRAGLVADVHAEIGEVLLGRAPGRETRDQITIFDSTGMAIQDTTTAALILRLAQERGIGTPFDFLAPET
ncbi:ornithine cyclodeaminase family protein [Roseicitreum antarcticum]|uniref:Ornithine cyclodeaminase n=1 Tax=Roseicitreum antarcticum TaxID=564137 RepID=A0A1H3DFD8_9RHOB|nr:ornithine cyclodeaminase family protein [Roseicitreum antarcticum]SDX65163.1 ornithine cyclodeaminase [Roseicitreum antarcticum]